MKKIAKLFVMFNGGKKKGVEKRIFVILLFLRIHIDWQQGYMEHLGEK